MADVSKINLFGTTYDVKDATARKNITQLSNQYTVLQGVVQQNTANIISVSETVDNIAETTVNVEYVESTETIQFTKGV